MNDPFRGWYVLYVKSQHEKKVDSSLKELGLDSFLPTTTVVRQWSDRKKKVVKPLFPSYVFINIHSKQEFFKALNVNAVFNYIRFGVKYARVHESDIGRIKHFLNLEGISEVDTNSVLPLKGEPMTIDYGPLNGLECEVLRADNKNKILVRIDSLKRNITAVVPNKFLSKRFQDKMEAS